MSLWALGFSSIICSNRWFKSSICCKFQKKVWLGFVMTEKESVWERQPLHVHRGTLAHPSPLHFPSLPLPLFLHTISYLSFQPFTISLLMRLLFFVNSRSHRRWTRVMHVDDAFFFFVFCFLILCMYLQMFHFII